MTASKRRGDASITIRLPATDAQWLKAEAARRGISISELVRERIAGYTPPVIFRVGEQHVDMESLNFWLRSKSGAERDAGGEA